MAFARVAWWRSGYAADCKSVYPSSNLGQASKVQHDVRTCAPARLAL